MFGAHVDVWRRLATFGGRYVFGSLLFGDEVWRRSLATLGACGHLAMFVWRLAYCQIHIRHVLSVYSIDLTTRG